MKMIDSYRMLTCRRSLCILLIYGALPAVLTVISGIILKLTDSKGLEDFIRGFIITFVQILLMVVAIVAPSFVFNANQRAMPGYRFFHSIPDGAERFSRALFFGNIAALLSIILEAVFWAIFLGVSGALRMPLIALTALGWINFFGSSGKWWVKLTPLVAVGFVYGFTAGAELDLMFPPVVTIIVTAAVFIIYIASAVYLFKNSKKLWARAE